ncbi:MAG TPA: long-chain fatty acid--CoA ligase, partial [Candidatus Competibacteraceae bacterium]|nr:long-chain fatty acid--CoA ligase [Candidatus Competibacteraceae bacterium]
EDWHFYIVDRLKDMFISGGENVYPAEIEAALYRHPAVFQCAVVGVPDAKWGEVGKAFVVLKPDLAASVEELLTHLGEQLARYKIPRHVEFVTALPISAAGKVLRRELRER